VLLLAIPCYFGQYFACIYIVKDNYVSTLKYA